MKRIFSRVNPFQILDSILGFDSVLMVGNHFRSDRGTDESLQNMAMNGPSDLGSINR